MRSAAFPFLAILLVAAFPAAARLPSSALEPTRLAAQDAYAMLTLRLTGYARVLARVEECLLHHPALARQAIPVLSLWQHRNAAAQAELLGRINEAASSLFPGENVADRQARLDALVARAASGVVTTEAPEPSICRQVIDELREGLHDLRGSPNPALR